MALRPSWLLAALLLLPCCKWAVANIAATIRHVTRYDSGVVQKEGDLVGGEQSGRWTFYYPDGRKRAEGSYQGDVQSGPWTSWYENGQIEWQGSYDDRGARTGCWTFFHDDGSRRAEGRLQRDCECGRWTFWDRSGAVERQGDFLNARVVGYWQYGPRAKEPPEAGLCHDGRRVGTWLEGRGDSAREVAYAIPDGMRLVRESRPDGALRRVGLLQGDQMVGGWTTFHDSGAQRLAVVFDNGAPRTFAMITAAGELFAEGLLEGHEILAWRVRREGRFVAEERTPLPQQPPSGGAISPDTLPDHEAPSRVLAIWLAELRAPAPPPPAVPPPPPPVVASPDAVAQPRVPAPKQPAWTVRESEEIEGHVQQYLAAPRQPRPALSRYAVAPAQQGTPRRRADLEGNPLPIEAMRTTDGKLVRFADYHGRRRVLLVVLRGYFGQVCVYCVAQTEALARCKDRFADLNLEVLLIYPGPEGNEEAFLAAYQEEFGKGPPPYRVCYDPDLQLCKQLGIEGGDLAYPSTLLVDEGGVVRYAYTGAHRADRPAAEELLKFIRNLDRR